MNDIAIKKILRRHPTLLYENLDVSEITCLEQYLSEMKLKKNSKNIAVQTEYQDHTFPGNPDYFNKYELGNKKICNPPRLAHYVDKTRKNISDKSDHINVDTLLRNGYVSRDKDDSKQNNLRKGVRREITHISEFAQPGMKNMVWNGNTSRCGVSTRRT